MCSLQEIMASFSPELVEDLAPLATYEQVLCYAADKLEQEGYVKPSFKDALLTREAEFPTGLRTTPYGVAIPHTYPEHVLKTGVYVMRLAEPVAAREMGSESDVVDDVQLVFMLLLTSESQLAMLQGLMALFSDEASMQAMRDAQEPADIYQCIEAFFAHYQEEGR